MGQEVIKSFLRDKMGILRNYIYKSVVVKEKVILVREQQESS